MSISEIVEKGLRCPSCNSKKLRAGYHEWQIMDSFICEKCGFRWNEDTDNIERWTNKVLDNATKASLSKRLIWVLHVVSRPNKPLKTTMSSDEGTYEQFIKPKKSGVK